MIPLLRLSVQLCRDHISLYADVDVEFNLLSEDHQDLAPEDETHNVSEIHSIVSSEDMSFQNLIIPPVYEVYRGYIVFAFSVCVCV